MLVGRSVHIFIDQLLSLEKCKLAEPVPELETIVGNQITIRLCDTDGKNYYLGQKETSPESSSAYNVEENKDGE